MISNSGSIYEGLLNIEGKEIGWGVCYYMGYLIDIGFSMYGGYIGNIIECELLDNVWMINKRYYPGTIPNEN